MACLRLVGKIPENREALTISRTSSTKEVKTFLNNVVGIGSRAHVAELNCYTTLLDKVV